MSEATPDQPAGVSRRRLLGFVGAGTAGILAAGAAGGAIGRATADGDHGHTADDAVPFAGRYQAGIVTPAQDRLHFIALDVTTDDRADSSIC